MSDKPVIDKEKSSIRVTALIGEKTELRCSAKGNPVPSFEWKKGELGRLGFKSTFVIKALKTTDYGDYKCVVTNALGTTVHNVKVVEVGT